MKWLPDFIERLKASAWHQLYLPLLPFTDARSESIKADSLKLQLLTARKKEWWPATADSLPQAVTHNFFDFFHFLIDCYKIYYCTVNEKHGC